MTVRIAYILLCHRNPERVIAQARLLAGAGDFVTVHFDRAAPRADFRLIQSALAEVPRVQVLARRRPCGWGQWSIVAATLDAARASLRAFPEASHVYLVSGDCWPIRPAQEIRAALAEASKDHIECADFFTSGWIRTGWCDERVIYRHVFNERRQRGLFYASYHAQRLLGLRRRPPAGLPLRIGSQWWCLRRATLEAVLRFAARRRDVTRFFRTTWIPDEIFFQTLVAHLVPSAQITGAPPTLLGFTDYGFPLTFHDDHRDLLLRQSAFFARKISPDATALQGQLARLYAAPARPDPPLGDDALPLASYLTKLGREGRRFGPRFWEAEARLGPGRRLYVILCPKYHVAKRLVGRIRPQAGMPCIDFLFDEEATPLPALGGLTGSLGKRRRHRLALLRQLYTHFGEDRLLICLDPSNHGLLRDLVPDAAQVRMLLLAPELDEGFLAAHARRLGLLSPGAGSFARADLLASLRRDMAGQMQAAAQSGLATFRLAQADTQEARAEALSRFLGLPPEAAADIVTPDLFDD